MTDAPQGSAGSPANAAPIRKAEARFATRNPEGRFAPLEALRNVVLWTFSDAFGLVSEEVMWAGFHLDQIFEPLAMKTPRNVPLSVRQEMLNGTYTSALRTMETKNDRSGGVPFDPEAKQATAHDWAAVVTAMVTECYTIRPLEESSINGRLVGLLRELGVDDPENPRAARYLPNDIRHRLNKR